MADEQNTAAVQTTITLKKILTHPYFSMVCVLSLTFILPQYGGTALMVGCASLLSAYVLLVPEWFRNRRGSLTTATCLVTAMWIGAAIIAALELTGQLRG